MHQGSQGLLLAEAVEALALSLVQLALGPREIARMQICLRAEEDRESEGDEGEPLNAGPGMFQVTKAARCAILAVAVQEAHAGPLAHLFLASNM